MHFEFQAAAVEGDAICLRGKVAGETVRMTMPTKDALRMIGEIEAEIHRSVEGQMESRSTEVG